MAMKNPDLPPADDNEWGEMPMESRRIDWADEMDRISPDSQAKTRLPESQTILDEEKGIRTEISYRFNAKNQKEKVTRIFRIEKKKIPKAIATREEWVKFGRASKDKPGVDPATTNDGEETFFSLTTNKDELELGIQEPKLKATDILRSIIEEDKDRRESQPDHSTQETRQSALAYVPPTRRPGYYDRAPPYSLDEPLPAVKISNLSMDTTEQDVKELLIQFGKVTRVHMPKDKKNRDVHKGSAFVTFQYRNNAEKAISMLNGYPYDHLILKAGWSKPMRRN